MRKRLQALFPPAAVGRVRQAVEEAERGTAGEIVPVVVSACDAHPEAAWKATALGALGAVAGAFLYFQLSGRWAADLLWWSLLPALAGGAAGWLAGGLPALRRRLVDPEVLEERVQRAARAAFLEHRVHATRQRTGVLIFVALFEHRVVVLADEGIHPAVPHAMWAEVAAGIASGLRAGRPLAALVEGIERCGRILATHGPAAAPGDVDELSDTPRLEER
ncbi:MAG TPA: hypothetical protein VMT16_11085 [Thermoanaerobaculia bacterium]|nr:hypothetical protein [Thermoanaerobaculia bacterium]